MKQIWVIRPGALGDTILTIPVLESLKKTYPESSITLFGSGSYGEIIPQDFAFEAVDSKRCLWLFEKTVTAPPPIDLKPDMVYVILKNPKQVVENLKLTGVRDIFLANPSPKRGVHLVETLCAELGLPCVERIPVLRRNRIKIKDNLLWVHPGSGGLKKIVPLQLFSEIARILIQERSLDVVITLGEADSLIKSGTAWNSWIEEMRPKILENIPLSELSLTLRGAGTYLGNDSGISHLAAGLGVNSVVFFTATDPTQWAPWVPPDQLTIIDYRSINLPKDLSIEAERIVELIIRKPLVDL